MDDQYVDVEEVNGAGKFRVIPTQEHSDRLEYDSLGARVRDYGYVCEEEVARYEVLKDKFAKPKMGPTLKDWLITQWEHDDRLNTEVDPEWLCGDAAPYDGGDEVNWDDPRDFSLGKTIRYCNHRGSEVRSPTPFLSPRRDNVTAEDARGHARMLYTEVSEMVYSGEWERIELSRDRKTGHHINRYVKVFLPLPKCLQGQEPPWAEGIVAYAFGNIVETTWWEEFEKRNPKRPQEPERFVYRPRPPPEELDRPPRPDGFAQALGTDKEDRSIGNTCGTCPYA